MSGEDPRERRTRPVEVFISYSHKDKELCDQLVGHLQALVTDGEIRIWYDRAITGGRQWAGEIDRHLESADLVLLLLSADFIKSEYCYKFEMGRALERQDAGEARVVPVVLRPVDLPDTLEQRQCLPAEGKAITTWANRDQAYVDAVKGIRRVLEEIGPKSPPVASLSEPVDTRLPDVRIVQVVVSQLFRITDLLVLPKKAVRARRFRDVLLDPKKMRSALRPGRFYRFWWQRALSVGSLGTLRPVVWWPEQSRKPLPRFWGAARTRLKGEDGRAPCFLPFGLPLEGHLKKLGFRPESILDGAAGVVENQQLSGRLRIYPPGVGVIRLAITLTFGEDVDVARLAPIASKITDLLFVDQDGREQPCEELLLEIIDRVAAHLFVEEEKPFASELRWHPPETAFSVRDDLGWDPEESVEALAFLMSQVSGDGAAATLPDRIRGALGSPRWRKEGVFAVAGPRVAFSFARGRKRRQYLEWLAETRELISAAAHAERAFVEQIDTLRSERRIDDDWAPGHDGFDRLETLLTVMKRVFQAIAATRDHLHNHGSGVLTSFAKELWAHDEPVSRSALEGGLRYVAGRLQRWRQSSDDEGLSRLEDCVDDILAIRPPFPGRR